MANSTPFGAPPRRSGAPTVKRWPLFGPACRDDLRDPAQLLVDVGQPGGGKEGWDRGAVEDPHPADCGAECDPLPHQDGFAAVAGEYHGPPARREHPHHLTEHADRLWHEVERGDAAHRVEFAVVEGNVERVSAHVDRAGVGVVAGRALYHRQRTVQPDDEPVASELSREKAGEIARPASHVEHTLLAAQMQGGGGCFALGGYRDPVRT